MAANDPKQATLPVLDEDKQGKRDVVVAPAWKDSVSGALWVHRDLVQVRKDWEAEQHVPLPAGAEQFGDVESWAALVTRFANPQRSLLTWSERGLRAVLDYHQEPLVDTNGLVVPGRAQWFATHPFVKSRELAAWEGFANGSAVGQRVAIERLEDLAPDIREPSAADLMLLLRSLRANVNAKAVTELRPDGTQAVTWSKDQTVRAARSVYETELPPFITISIPLLAGQGSPVPLAVRVRVSVDSEAKLTLRFTLVNADRALELVYLERVAEARSLLGESFPLLRAAN